MKRSMNSDAAERIARVLDAYPRIWTGNRFLVAPSSSQVACNEKLTIGQRGRDSRALGFSRFGVALAIRRAGLTLPSDIDWGRQDQGGRTCLIIHRKTC